MLTSKPKPVRSLAYKMKRARESRRLVGRVMVTDKMLDHLARRLVFKRDGYACVRCGKACTQELHERGDRTIYVGIQWCHVHTRRIRSLKWDPDNALTLCPGCHLWWHGHVPESADPFADDEHRYDSAMEWFKRKYPERSARLAMRLQTPSHPDYGAIYVWLRNEVLRNGA